MELYNLFDYQKEGLSFLMKHKGGLLCDEQGLGKTIQSLAFLYGVQPHRTLIVCPAIMRFTWYVEIRKCSSFEGKLIQVIKSNKEEIDAASDIVICSYNYIAASYNKKSLYTHFDCVICDESHYIKTPTTKRTKACLKLLTSDVCKYKLLLTGTPVCRGVDDLYTQLRPFFPYDGNNDLLGKNIWAFRQRYMFSKITHFGTEWFGVRNEDKLKEILSIISLRRLKKDVLKELPLLSHKKVYCELEGCEDLRNESLKIFSKIKDFVEKGSSIRLQRDKILNDHIASVRKALGLKKINFTVEYVLERLSASDKPLIVFGYHTDVLKAISDSLSYHNIKNGLITGATPIAERDRLISSFQKNDEDSPRVLVMNILAGGVGVTLTAADTAIFAELDWTPANLLQAEARCHRIGQQSDNVNIVYILAANSLDDRIFSVIENKMRTLRKLEL